MCLSVIVKPRQGRPLPGIGSKRHGEDVGETRQLRNSARFVRNEKYTRPLFDKPSRRWQVNVNLTKAKVSWGSRDKATLIVKLGTRWRWMVLSCPGHFSPTKKSPVPDRGLVGPRACVDDLEESKMSCNCGESNPGSTCLQPSITTITGTPFLRKTTENRTPDQPACSLALQRLYRHSIPQKNNGESNPGSSCLQPSITKITGTLFLRKTHLDVHRGINWLRITAHGGYLWIRMMNFRAVP